MSDEESINNHTDSRCSAGGAAPGTEESFFVLCAHIHIRRDLKIAVTHNKK